ncbi:MAG TPA: hypothetical protein VGG39_08920 [Polyangiaceae bacterium]|jgi:hypothetical protein
MSTKRDARPSIVWHYTVETFCLPGILADGAIHTTDGGLGAKERPAVWFSRRHSWEPTALKGLIDPETGVRRNATFAEMASDLGLARIGVRPDGLTTWLEHRRIGGIPADEARWLVKSAIMLGSNPGDWFVDYGDVTRDRWVTVQRWDDGVWVDCEVGCSHNTGRLAASA